MALGMISRYVFGLWNSHPPFWCAFDGAWRIIIIIIIIIIEFIVLFYPTQGANAPEVCSVKQQLQSKLQSLL